MSKGIIEQIRERVASAADGTVFTTSDFLDIANNVTVRQSLHRLVKEGILKRVINGVFEKPKYSKLLGEVVATNPDEVAKAIARNYHWTISPCGNTALNMFGISTQVPSGWLYCSDGPYKEYKWNTTKLEFKHRTNRDISGLSEITALLIQALKALGKESVSQDIVNYLSDRLTDEQKSIVLSEARGTTSWVYQYVQQICERSNN